MAPIPAQMQAIQITKFGGPDVLELATVPVPSAPGDGELLVRNEYAGVNYIDTYFRTGLYKGPLPQIMGREAAGTVVTSKSPAFKEGDRVVFMDAGATSYANYSKVQAANAAKVPDGMSTETACAAFQQGLTAWTFIEVAGQVKPGQWTLVHAAAGGVGGLLVQMLKAVGAKVIATAGSEEKCKVAASYGADHVIPSRGDDVASKVKQITGGHGIDVIFDGVGKSTWDMDIDMVAVMGTLVSYGNASGAVPPINIITLGTPKNIRLLRPVVNVYTAQPGMLAKYTSELFDMITANKVKVLVHKVYPLKDARQAHIDIEGRGTMGKLLLDCA